MALAAELGVSVRTVYRDVDELSASGVPVYAERGRHGGFQLLGGYETHLTGLAAGEAEALLLAGLPGPAADLGLESSISARLKLLASVPAESRSAAMRVGDRFHLDPESWYRRSKTPPHLREIAQAVWGERRIACKYESWSATRERRLDPLGLVLKGGAWYLMARTPPDAIRVYKVANFVELRVLDESFHYPRRFNLAEWWRKEINRFEASLRRSEAVLRVSAAAVRSVDRLGSAIEEAILRAEPDRSGWRTATVPIESVGHAAALLLGFADAIEVLSPPELRREIALRARRTAMLYRKGRKAKNGR